MFTILIDLVSAILLLSGAGTIEDLSAEELERFYEFTEQPIRINILPKKRLLASGLFSFYQVDAIEEYRKNSGDILSLNEFALVDGVGPMYAQALGYFISFDSSRPPGQKEDTQIRQNIMVRSSAKAKGIELPAGLETPKLADSFAGGNNSFNVGAKYHIQFGDKAELFLSAKGDALPTGALSLAFYSRSGGKIVLGDFAARFGQGLSLWTGLSMTGFSSVDSFRKNPSGFCATSSFNPTLSGIASDFSLGHWTISAGIAVPALRSFFSAPTSTSSKENSLSKFTKQTIPILAVSNHSRMGQFGFQALYKDGLVLSADGIVGFKHWTVFTEMSLSAKQITENDYTINRTRFACLLGANYSPAYKVKASFLARHYPTGFYSPFAGAARTFSALQDQSGVALGIRWHWAEFTADASMHPSTKNGQIKTILSLKPDFKLWGISFSPSLRWTERANVKSDFTVKHELRGDLQASSGPFMLNLRGHIVAVQNKNGHLAYLELGYKSQKELSAFIRGTYFNTPDYDTRIYCYERDLPGSFNVPALYTRGYRLSTLLGVKGATSMRFRYGVYFKASLCRYLGIETSLPSSTIKAPIAEIKLQLQSSF